MVNNLTNIKKEKVVKDVITFGLATAEQVINELPDKDLEEMGGLKSLLNRTKINIANSLANYGFTDYAKKISSLDENSFPNFFQFKTQLNSLA